MDRKNFLKLSSETGGDSNVDNFERLSEVQESDGLKVDHSVRYEGH